MIISLIVGYVILQTFVDVTYAGDAVSAVTIEARTLGGTQHFYKFSVNDYASALVDDLVNMIAEEHACDPETITLTDPQGKILRNQYSLQNEVDNAPFLHLIFDEKKKKVVTITVENIDDPDNVHEYEIPYTQYLRCTVGYFKSMICEEEHIDETQIELLKDDHVLDDNRQRLTQYIQDGTNQFTLKMKILQSFKVQLYLEGSTDTFEAARTATTEDLKSTLSRHYNKNNENIKIAWGWFSGFPVGNLSNIKIDDTVKSLKEISEQYFHKKNTLIGICIFSD